MTEAPFALTPNQGPWREEWDSWRGPLDFGSLVALHGPLKAGDDCVFPDSGWGISAQAGGEGMGWPPEEPHTAVSAEGWSLPRLPCPFGRNCTWVPTAPDGEGSLSFHAEKLPPQPAGKPAPLHAYTHTQAHTHTLAYTCAHTHTHRRMHTHTHTPVHACTHTHTPVHAHTHTHTHTPTHAHTHPDACTHTEAHTYTPAYARAHTHTHTPRRLTSTVDFQSWQ